ncbi:hypothetical protein Val02_20810 [Virgisporangium aliadipatigenens]|uniref:Uncharacterized protein n=1 Tax=Virgisporangium aliadipatigenens TaxID=741659 RepID=A0A8J3YJN4_9ACTN|nr:hypothetical protein Val02_20810 [Virgisporangium aliadipatigenens]
MNGRSDDQLRAEFRQRYARLIHSGGRAAFVLTFGTAPVVNTGTAFAERANRLLLESVPEIFQGSAQRSFWKGNNNGGDATGVVSVELYLFT